MANAARPLAGGRVLIPKNAYLEGRVAAPYSEKRLWVPYPYGFQGAVFVPRVLGYSTRRDTIHSWELSSKTPIFLAELLCSVEREPHPNSLRLSRRRRDTRGVSQGVSHCLA